jgi:hypothetical protein
VLARGKDLHRLRTRSPCDFQQARMKALIQEHVCGENSQHKNKIPQAGSMG